MTMWRWQRCVISPTWGSQFVLSPHARDSQQSAASSNRGSYNHPMPASCEPLAHGNGIGGGCLLITKQGGLPAVCTAANIVARASTELVTEPAKMQQKHDKRVCA
eukprot:CAMPEP_0172668750 /NCGR_PEP_ID=MMETSP1074-20121228/9253_1 /TAXON_ID=2916 /ORGANISM="Ceratium fusus, Strain PA161109" /LENGTH=104 /DNA_ID=CAMNT_0013485435 /DNA_START=926 /DNA_END=1238 /DNA_ORIENTATION=-